MRFETDSHEVLRSIIEGTTDAVFVKDLEGRYLLVNSACARFLGLPAEEIVGRSDADLYAPETAWQFRRDDRAVLAAGVPLVFEGLVTGPWGEQEYRVTKGVVRDARGEVVALFGISHDITDRRRAEVERLARAREQVARETAEAAARAKDELLRALSESEERYRAFIIHSSEGIWRFELDRPIPTDAPESEQVALFYELGYLAECNDAAARMYGFERASEIVGARLSDLLVRSDPANEEYLLSFISSGYRLTDVESVEVDREGRRRHFLNSLVGAVEENRLVRVWGTQRDVTERRRLHEEREELLRLEREARAGAEEALARQREVEESLKALVEASGSLLGSPRSEVVLPAILQLSRRLFPADAYAVWRHRKKESRWEVAVAEGLSDEYQREQIAVTSQTPSMPESPIVVEDVSGATVLSECLETYRREGIRSLISLPLKVHGETVGTLVFYYRAPRRFAETEITVASAIANLSASALGTSDLYEEQSRLRLEAEAAERRSALLAEAASVLSSSLDYERTLEAVARLAVPRTADWCAVDIVGEGGEVRRLAVAHVDPAKVAWARELHDRYPYEPEAPSGVPNVIRTGRSELYADIPDEMLVAVARDEEHLCILRELGFTSAMIVPLAVHGRVAGALTFASAESGRRYGPVDLAFAEELAGRAALAVENSRLYRDAREANRMKDEFLATLSHELRTPLTAILGWASMLRTSRFDEESTRRAIETIERNARAQKLIVEDVLDVSRIITGKIRLDSQPVEVRAVVEAAVESMRPAAEAKGVFLSTMLAPDAGVVSGDPGRLQQVMWNLLSNAVKFTPPGGRVEVELQRVESQALLRVSDTGQGITPEFLPHVFDRFRQADQSTTRTHGGLGLGLAIVRHIVELHGGTVRAESVGEGHGASFTVALPLKAVVQAEDVAETAPKASACAAAKASEATPPTLAGTRILLVEDDEDALEMLRRLLEERGARVRAVGSAAAAWEALEAERPDVLVCDIGMPVEDGYSFVRRLRESEARRGGKLPAIALTAYARDEDRTRALLAGFHAHVPKPVNPPELLAVVASLAALASAR